MRSRLIRRIVVALLALYALGQTSIALAACGMDRGAMAQTMTMPAGDPCDGCANTGTDSLTAVCVVHCTADMQLAGAPPDAVAVPAARPFEGPPAPHFRSPPIIPYLPPPGPLPRRILLHSFQV